MTKFNIKRVMDFIIDYLTYFFHKPRQPGLRRPDSLRGGLPGKQTPNPAVLKLLTEEMCVSPQGNGVKTNKPVLEQES